MHFLYKISYHLLNNNSFCSRIQYGHDLEIDNNTISYLKIISMKKSDQGNYTCMAHNTAGSYLNSITLVLIEQNNNTSNIILENYSAGFATIIAALFGILLSLSFLFIGIFLYARWLHTNSSNCLKLNTPMSNPIYSFILKKKFTDYSFQKECSLRKKVQNIRDGKNFNDESMISHILNDHKTNSVCQKTLSDNNENLNYHQCVCYNNLIEPDFIHKVLQENSISVTCTESSFQIFEKPVCGYLDEDGYPYNYGLPKINPTFYNTKELRNKTASKKTPQFKYTNSTSSTVSSNSFINKPEKSLTVTMHDLSSEMKCASIISPQFIPSPPAAYKNEKDLKSYSFIPLILHSSVTSDKSESESKKDSSRNDNIYKTKQAESKEFYDYSESPDEGYVGDAMDI